MGEQTVDLEQLRQRHEQQRRRHLRVSTDRELAAAARERLGRERIGSRSDRARIARNLAAIIDRAAEKGIRSGAIVRKSGVGGNSSCLSKYVLRVEKPTKEQLGRLVQTGVPYALLAEAAAHLAGFDPDATLLELVDGSRLDPRLAGADLPEQKTADWLYDLLQSAARKIAADHRLDRYFKDLSTHRIERTSEGWRYIDGGWRDDGHEWPTVNLFIQIESRTPGAYRRKDDKQNLVHAEIAFGHQVSLSIGTDADCAPVMYLRRFPFTLLISANSMYSRRMRDAGFDFSRLNFSDPILFGGYPEQLEGPSRGWLPDGTLVIYMPLPGRKLDLGGFKPDPTHSYDPVELVHFERITRTALAKLCEAKDDLYIRPGDALPIQIPPGMVLAVPGTIGERLEALLLNGRVDEGDSVPMGPPTLDPIELLNEQARDLARSLETWVEGERNLALERRQKLIDRWYR
ncbi:MAG TPA: hypothetical protein VED40_23415 [Azospirillaceae bacterium]|nr:hypothetical protein [Azospirillaceae bacterium]